MKIVHIFAQRLFSFHYEGEVDHEYDRLMNLWDDAEYVYEFLKASKDDLPKDKSIREIAERITEDSYAIDDTLIEITESDDKPLSYFFKPLHNQEYKIKVLSLQKGRESYLRIYAIRVDEDTFVITGGAIKFHHLMQDREHTEIELAKLKKAKDYLAEQGIIDENSFFEFLNEQ